MKKICQFDLILFITFRNEMWMEERFASNVSHSARTNYIKAKHVVPNFMIMIPINYNVSGRHHVLDLLIYDLYLFKKVFSIFLLSRLNKT